MNCLKSIAFISALIFAPILSAQSIVNLSDYGIKPNTGKDMSARMTQALSKIKAEHAQNDSITIMLLPGKYNFHSNKAEIHPYYISNHDQD